MLNRCFNSVKNQTYRNIEHIIVDDGSTDDPDEIIIQYLKTADYPVIYLKKENGGVHTARNLAIKYARGEYTLFLDSDDEFVPTAVDDFLCAWSKIPSESRNEYREVIALCMDKEGRQIGKCFVDGINYMSKIEAAKARRDNKVEHTAMNRTEILKNTPWPEPEGVKFVAESIVWNQLDCRYKKWYLNKCLRIYHIESDDSITKQLKNNNIQSCVNDLFRYQYILNNNGLYNLSTKDKVKNMILYNVFYQYLKSKDVFPQTDWAEYGLKGYFNYILKSILFLPVKITYPFILKKKFRR